MCISLEKAVAPVYFLTELFISCYVFASSRKLQIKVLLLNFSRPIILSERWLPFAISLHQQLILASEAETKNAIKGKVSCPSFLRWHMLIISRHRPATLNMHTIYYVSNIYELFFKTGQIRISKISQFLLIVSKTYQTEIDHGIGEKSLYKWPRYRARSLSDKQPSTFISLSHCMDLALLEKKLIICMYTA